MNDDRRDEMASRLSVFEEVSPPDTWAQAVRRSEEPVVTARPRWRVVAAAAAVLAVVAAAVQVWPESNGDQPVSVSPATDLAPTSSTTSVTTTTSGLTDDPVVSPLRALEEPVPLRILSLHPNSGLVAPDAPQLAVADLEHRELREYPLSSSRLPFGGISGAAITPRGDALVWIAHTVYVFPDADFTRPPGELQPVSPWQEQEIPDVAPELFVVPTPDGEHVWIVQPTSAAAEGGSTVVGLADVDSGEFVVATGLDGEKALPVDATESGLVLQVQDPASGHDQRIVLVDLSGEIREIGEGRAVAAYQDTVVALVRGADADTMERLVIIDALSGETTVVEASRNGRWLGVGGPGIPSTAQPLPTVSMDGHLLMAISDSWDANGVPQDATLLSVDLADGSTETLISFTGETPLATWTADGEHVALIADRQVSLLDIEDPALETTVVAHLPDQTWPLGAG